MRREMIEKMAHMSHSVPPALPNIKSLKASFCGCSVDERKVFSQSSCILPISILGRKEHERERFAATMKLVNASFRSGISLVMPA